MALSAKLRKKMEQRKKEMESKGGGMKGLVSFKEGKTRIRFLPVGDNDFAFMATQFYLGKEIGGFISPATFGEPCAVYEAYTKLNKSSDDDDRELAKSFRPREKPLAPIIKYKDEKGKEVDTEKGVALAILTQDNYTELIDWMLDEDDYGDFTDPKTGYDVKINRTGSGQYDTKYKLMKCDSSKLPKEFAGKTYDAEEMVRKLVISYEETEAFRDRFLGGSVDDDDDEPKKKKKKKSKTDDDEPKKKKKKKK